MTASLPKLEHSYRLLVVDDESVITFALRQYFTALGFEVDVAAEREEAIALLATCDYDIVIADLRLTGAEAEEGLDVIGYARSRNLTSGVVLLTAYGNPAVMNRARSCGADLLMQKPQPLPDIARAVYGLLGVAS